MLVVFFEQRSIGQSEAYHLTAPIWSLEMTLCVLQRGRFGKNSRRRVGSLRPTSRCKCLLLIKGWNITPPVAEMPILVSDLGLFLPAPVLVAAVAAGDVAVSLGQPLLGRR